MEIPSINVHGELFPDAVTARFHDRYRQANAAADGPPRVRWLGIEALKCPLDLWIYQEILTAYQPDLVIEGGTAGAGSALFLASVCDLLGHGHVVTIDLDHDPAWPRHPRLAYVQGDTLDPRTVERARRIPAATPTRTVLILDDGHSAAHVEQELRLWTPTLRPDDWLIVEDTNLGGPYWGLQAFLRDEPDDRWVRQPACERFLLTCNPWGYWRRAA